MAPDRFTQITHIGNQQIISDQLDRIADSLCQQFPSFPVILRHAVFNGIDGKCAHQLFQIFDLFHSAAFTAAGFPVTVNSSVRIIEFTGGTVECESNLSTGGDGTRFQTGVFDGMHQIFTCFFNGMQGRGKTAFIADCCIHAVFRQSFFQRLENFCAPAESLMEIGCSDRTNHEFLKINGGIRMRPAVDQVHHRNRQFTALNSADITVQRQMSGFRGGFDTCQRYPQNGIGAQSGFVFRAVQFNQSAVELFLMQCIHAGDPVGDFAIDMGTGFQNAFAVIAFRIFVAQFQCFMTSGGCSGRNCCFGSDFIVQCDADRDGWISS